MGVIACAHGDHALRRLLWRQLRQFVAGATLLKGGSELQVFEFEKYLRTGDVGQGFGSNTGCAQHVAMEPLCSRKDVVVINHRDIVRQIMVSPGL